MTGRHHRNTQSELKADAQLAGLFPDLAHIQPLYEAALAHQLDLAFMQRETVMPRAWRAARNLPIVAVLSDTVGTPAGPATWTAAAELISWADIAILHREGARPGHYAHAGELAKTHLRALLIEAPAVQFYDWLEVLEQQPGLTLEAIQ